MSPFPADESSSDYDGFMSHDGEWHAFVVGFGAGFAGTLPSPKLRDYTYRVIGQYEPEVTLAMAESKSESWYAIAGVIVGACFALAFVALQLRLLTKLLGDDW